MNEQRERMSGAGEAGANLTDLLDCPAGHRAEFWLTEGWVLAGCKKCGHAAAAYKSFEQASHDWNAMMAI